MTTVSRRIELAKAVTLYLGDCRQVLPLLEQVTALVTDSPYGINYEVNERRNTGRGLTATGPALVQKRKAIEGDSEPFDPAHLLGFRKVALFGANHMDGLPAGGRWIVWDKRRDSKPDDHSDCEMIWTNQKGADRIHRQKWRGVVREGEENCANSKKLHPNQKPVALLGFVFDQIGIAEGDVVCDPYMGSGSTGVVAIRRGLPFVGIEKDPGHFEVARARLLAEIEKQAAEPSFLLAAE